MEKNNQPSLDVLRRFACFENLNKQQLILIAAACEQLSVGAKITLFNIGETDDKEYFLLSGAIKLTAADGISKTIIADSKESIAPLARLKPRLFKGETTQKSQLLVFDQSRLDQFLSDNKTTLSSLIHEDEVEEQSFFDRFSEDLIQNRLQLPTLPQIAIAVKEELNRSNNHLNDITHILKQDPAIAAKVLAAANSPLFRGISPCDTLSGAISRLGTKATEQLVIALSLQELLQVKSRLLRPQIHEFWRESVEVACLSHALAKHSNQFNPEKALLVGLVHNIGFIPIVLYADHTDEECTIAELDELNQEFGRRITQAILHKWNFPEDIAEAALHSHDWYYVSSKPEDYTNLLIMAQLHYAMFNRTHFPELPRISLIPASKHIGIGDFNPQFSLQIKKEADKNMESFHAIVTNK
ncbi:HDOD domain-containing protein [Spartinivicinus poritis]|uniref:HDOD domain-containing protein n=1 Tax=Spartinivicinus poritis TaxID=2994640 RepID=A0ABT5U2A6_9GAMM|nr:HDOD domain-containing protein [Spartinivicinus sp. A2-2]MDE1460489.1 HDOD domain-containing protein [Spartinivicinus sp. A2-2]